MSALFAKGNRTIVGMVHLGKLPGQGGFTSMEAVIEGALADLRELEAGGIDAVLVENWEDRSSSPFVIPEAGAAMRVATAEVAQAARVPVGINVLPNDYPTAFSVAAEAGLAFVQLDVFCDEVRTNYSFSEVRPFEVHVDPQLVLAWRRKLGAQNVKLLATVQPKHYVLLEQGKPLDQSVREAVAAGADAVVVTGEATGSAPTRERLEIARGAAGDLPVLVGSGLRADNAADLLALADGAIVGTSLKTGDFARVERARVSALIAACRKE